MSSSKMSLSLSLLSLFTTKGFMELDPENAHQHSVAFGPYLSIYTHGCF